MQFALKFSQQTPHISHMQFALKFSQQTPHISHMQFALKFSQQTPHISHMQFALKFSQQTPHISPMQFALKFSQQTSHISPMQFALKFSQQTPHISPSRVRYWVSVVSLNSDSYSASVTAVLWNIMEYWTSLCRHSTICTVQKNLLTHWGWVMHICVSKLTTIGSDNGLAPTRS